MAVFELIELYRDESRLLYQVTDVTLWQRRAESSGQCFATVRPIAVVVCEKRGSRAIGLNGDKLDIETLRRDCPPLGELLGSQCDT